MKISNIGKDVITVRIPVQNKKHVPVPISLQSGPKKGVNPGHDVHFGQTWTKKIRNGFLC